MEFNLKYDPYKTIMEDELGRAEDEPAFYYHGDHLGSSAYLTDEAGAITQTLNYLPYGEDWVDVHNSPNYLSRYKYNGKEKDPESGLHYYGARYYDSDISQWLSIDPMADKYPSLSPYNYCADNPVILVDPDGREGVVVSGSPGDHSNKKHFLINGFARAKAAQQRAKNGEGTTWLIYNDKEKGFDQHDLNKYKKEAQDAGIKVRIVSDVNDIIDYINNKTGGKSRNRDKISSFYYVGHATPGDLDVGYAGSGQHFDPSDLNPSAFKSGAWVNLVGGCRTAIDDNLMGIITIEKSVIKQFADILDRKSIIHGSNKRVVYTGGVMSDQGLLKKNKGSIITIRGNIK